MKNGELIEYNIVKSIFLVSFDSNFTEVYTSGSIWQLVSLGSGNGLLLTNKQPITWTNVV